MQWLCLLLEAGLCTQLQSLFLKYPSQINFHTTCMHVVCLSYRWQCLCLSSELYLIPCSTIALIQLGLLQLVGQLNNLFMAGQADLSTCIQATCIEVTTFSFSCFHLGCGQPKIKTKNINKDLYECSPNTQKY